MKTAFSSLLTEQSKSQAPSPKPQAQLIKTYKPAPPYAGALIILLLISCVILHTEYTLSQGQGQGLWNAIGQDGVTTNRTVSIYNDLSVSGNAIFDSSLTARSLYSYYLSVTDNTTINRLSVGGDARFYRPTYFDSLMTANEIRAQLLGAGIIIGDSAQLESVVSSFINATRINGIDIYSTKITAERINTDTVVTVLLSCGNAKFTGTVLASDISTGALTVTGTSTLHKIIVSDGVTVTSLAGNGQGLIQYDTTGKLTQLDFTNDSNEVLTGNGTFRNISALVPPDTGWQWYDSTVLLSTAPVVAIQNNLVVGNRVSIGAIRMSNGTGVDSLRTARQFALEAQKIFLKSDTVTVSGLQVTEEANKVTLEARQRDTVSIPEIVTIGRVDTSRVFPPSAGKVALDVAGDLRSSGSMVSRAFMFDDQYGVTFDANIGLMPPSIYFGKIHLPRIPPPPCFSIPPDPNNWIFRTGTIQSLAYNNSGNPFAALTLGSAGWSGNGIIEVEGTDLQGGTTNGLMINYFCGRNTVINTNTGLPNRGGNIYMGERVFMLKSAQIGWTPDPIDESITLKMIVNPENNLSRKGIRFDTWDNSAKLISVYNPNFGYSPFTLFGSGQVALGDLTNVPVAYLLAVKGKIIAEDITLKLYSDGWPDYVFSPDYKRPSWLERKNYHQKNRCMMYMERAPEVNEKGMTVGRNMTGLTRNMEEAWEEIIGLHEENETLKAEIELLKKKIERMEKKR